MCSETQNCRGAVRIDRVGSEVYLSKLLPVGLNTPKCEVKPEQFSYKGLVLYRPRETDNVYEMAMSVTGLSSCLNCAALLLFDYEKESEC